MNKIKLIKLAGNLSDIILYTLHYINDVHYYKKLYFVLIWQKTYPGLIYKKSMPNTAG